MEARAPRSAVRCNGNEVPGRPSSAAAPVPLRASVLTPTGREVDGLMSDAAVEIGVGVPRRGHGCAVGRQAHPSLGVERGVGLRLDAARVKERLEEVVVVDRAGLRGRWGQRGEHAYEQCGEQREAAAEVAVGRMVRRHNQAYCIPVFRLERSTRRRIHAPYVQTRCRHASCSAVTAAINRSSRRGRPLLRSVQTGQRAHHHAA